MGVADLNRGVIYCKRYGVFPRTRVLDWICHTKHNIKLYQPIESLDD